MDQAVSRQSLITDAGFHSLLRSCRICGGQSKLEQVSVRVL